MALTERVHSDGAIPPGRKCFLLMFWPPTLWSLHNIKLSYSSLSLHPMMMSWHWVQHTPSTAYTEYSIHQVQHTPSTAYTDHSIHWLQHTPGKAYTEYSIHPRLFVIPSFSWVEDDPWIQRQRLACLPTGSTAISQLYLTAQRKNNLVTFPWLPVSSLMNSVGAPGAPSIDHFQVPVQSRLIMASKCIWKLTPSWPPGVSLNSVDYHLPVNLTTCLIMASKFISKHARSQPPSVTLHLHDLCLEVHLQTCSITATKCISKLVRLGPPSSLNHGLQVHLQTCFITASKCISEFTQSSFSGAPWSALKYRLQLVEIYSV